MDLAHLDDITPPAPNAALRANVAAIARRRRRTRVEVEAATALFVVAGVTIGIGVTREQHSSVHVVTRPASTTAPASKPFKYSVPSDSMAPTLKSNDEVLVDRSSRGRPVQRGDIIVFQAPPGETSESIKDLVKRVIGLPGDTVEARDGRVFIIPANDTAGYVLSEPYVVPTPDCPAGTQGPVAGRALHTVHIPAGEYFVMGDNRCTSEDSRAFGPIKQSSILGRAFVHINTQTTSDVTVKIELDHDTVAAGGTVTGTLVFDNPNNHLMIFPPGAACLAHYEVAIGPPPAPTPDHLQDCVSERVSRASAAGGAFVPGHLAIPAGITRVRFSVPHVRITGQPLLHPLPRGRELVYFVPEVRSPYLVVGAPVPLTIK